jgi:predicted acyl esterase
VGGSYTGATAALTMSHGHPALVAACPGQIAFDLFDYGYLPGGVYCKKIFQ